MASTETPRTDLASALWFSGFPTALGTLWVAYSGELVRRAELGVDADSFVRACGEALGLIAAFRAPSPSLRDAVMRCVEGTAPYAGPLDLSPLSGFQQRVLMKTREIPYGEVRSYGWVAREIRAPAAVRATGTALGRNPIPILIPCHRVLQADYRLGQYGMGGPAKKRALLEAEGVRVPLLADLARRGLRYQVNSSQATYCVPGCRQSMDAPPAFVGSLKETAAAGLLPCPHCRPL